MLQGHCSKNKLLENHRPPEQERSKPSSRLSKLHEIALGCIRAVPGYVLTKLDVTPISRLWCYSLHPQVGPSAWQKRSREASDELLADSIDGA